MANQSQCCYRLGMRGLFITQLPLSFLCYWEVMRGLSGTQERKGWPNGDTHIYTIVSLFQCQLYVMNGFKCYVHPPWFTAWPEAKHQAKLKSLKKREPKQAVPTPEAIISIMSTMLGSWLTQFLFWDRKWIVLFVHFN